jgi:hypothetical protein
MPQPTIYGSWTVRYSYVTATQVQTCAANVGGFSNTQNAALTFIPAHADPPPITLEPGVWPQWRDLYGPGPHAPNVWHTVEWKHTATVDDWTIDGFLVEGISPDLQAAYEAQETAFPATNMAFYAYGDLNLAFDNDVTVTYGPIRLGTTPGASDLLYYDPATDGLQPWASVVGHVEITALGLQCGPANGAGGVLNSPNGVTFNLDSPWPPTFTFHCSFSVGTTLNTELSLSLPPPDNIVLVQAALPETLLSQGYRVECGTFTPEGAPRPIDSVRDATVAFVTPQEPEDET